MDSSTLLYLAGFFFILGAAIVAIFWMLLTIIRRISHKNNEGDKANQDLAEVARLMRNVKTQDLAVEMDGKIFKAVHELSTRQQHHLSFASDVLVKWLGAPAPVDTSAAVNQPAIPSLDPSAQESDWIPAEAVSMEPKTTVVPPFVAEPDRVVKPVSTQLPDLVGGILNPKPAPSPVYKSIAMQINDILQARIAGTAFESRGITVNDAPDHGVVVTMNGEKYQGVKDVPDESVRDLIRSAVMEWEKQSKGSS